MTHTKLPSMEYTSKLLQNSHTHIFNIGMIRVSKNRNRKYGSMNIEFTGVPMEFIKYSDSKDKHWTEMYIVPWM